MDKSKVVNLLNQALVIEHSSYIRYATQAVLLRGPEALAVAAKFKDFAEGEVRHAAEVRERLVALGDTPTTSAAKIELGNNLQKMLEINIGQEKEAMALYQKLMKLVPKEENLLLYEVVEDILRDTQQDLEELERLTE